MISLLIKRFAGKKQLTPIGLSGSALGNSRFLCPNCNCYFLSILIAFHSMSYFWSLYYQFRKNLFTIRKYQCDQAMPASHKTRKLKKKKLNISVSQSSFSNADKLESPLTKGGYHFDEVVSALQKDIRLGNVFNAVFWAKELDEFNEETGSGGTALWNRLKTISSEDVGIANPIAPVVIQVLAEQYRDFKQRKDDAYRLFLY